MMEELHFVADAALIERLGRELVTKQETALIELIKNGYDADASEVVVTIEPGERLLVEDNGSGMTREQVVNGFLRLASDAKIVQPLSPRYLRQRAGRKGIGRFAAQRLGSVLKLKTWPEGGMVGYELVVNWNDFQSQTRLEDVVVRLSELPVREAGTIIEIEGLRDTWSDAQVRRCWRGVVSLQEPFPISAVAAKTGGDPGFLVRIGVREREVSDPEVVVDLQSEVLRYAHSLIEVDVNAEGLARWRLCENEFGADRDWTAINHRHRDGVRSAKYSTLSNITMRAYYFILDRSLFPSSVYNRLRTVLRHQGGIRLYRNGFRVVPYGEVGDDWLGLDETYAQRGTILAPIRNLNFCGFVEVHDPEGVRFEENTSREGLIESEAFDDLKGLVSSVIATAVLQVAEDRGRKLSAGGVARGEASPSPLDKIREAERKVRARVRGRTPDAHSEADRGEENEKTDKNEKEVVEEIADLLRESGDAIEQRETELADESTILRLLATLGLTAAEFSHETGMTFEAVQISFRNVFAAAREFKAHDEAFLQEVDIADLLVNRLSALTNYINSVASARAVRKLEPVSVSGEIEKFLNGVNRHAERRDIEMQIDIPPIDALYTSPMHEADVATILLNFYSNAIKAMQRAGKKRKLLVTATRSSKNEIVMTFSDTGDGIAEENYDKIFDLFFTTRIGAPLDANPDEQITGTGLGLWIVRQVVENVGGSVKVGEVPAGYSACIEVRLPGEKRESQ